MSTTFDKHGGTQTAVDAATAPPPPIDRPEVEGDAEGLAAAEAEQAQQIAEGQVDADDSAVREPPMSPRAWDGHVPEGLTKILDTRIAIWDSLLTLDEHREKLRVEGASESVIGEISRQTRELQMLPSAEGMRSWLERVNEQLRAATRPPEPPEEPEPEDASEPSNSDSSDPAESQDDEPEEDGDGDKSATDRAEPPLVFTDPDFIKVLKLGIAQAKLLLAREQTDSLIPTAAAAIGAGEPLVTLCRQHKVDGNALMGWTFYAMALEHRIAGYRQLVGTQQEASAKGEATGNRSWLRSLFDRKGADEGATATSTCQVQRLCRAAEREYKAIERKLANLFWATYEEMAWLLADGRLSEAEQPSARALLRYGLVSTHPGAIDPEKLQQVLDDCTRDVREWQDTLGAVHVVYPDEYILAIARRQTTPSPDEELELNGRRTPEWKADRAWRLAVVNRVRARLFEAECERLQTEITRLEEKRAADEKRLDQLRRSSKPSAKVSKLEKDLTATRSQIGRSSRAMEMLRTKFMAAQNEAASQADAKFAEVASVLSTETVIRREARFIRRLARLTARLKEPYPPFVLRDWIVPGRPEHHHRAVVEEAIQSMEKADRRIFHQVLVNNKDVDKSVTVRNPPTCLIVPARGLMGFAVNPRKLNDCGRFAVPLASQRARMLHSMLWDLFADFRWDCSREDAGTDWVTADALCSAYATVRWNYRRRGAAIQRGAGIDRQKRDRQNWQLHYSLFAQSAFDGGRRLFITCAEIYGALLKYVGLPEGVQPLKRS